MEDNELKKNVEGKIEEKAIDEVVETVKEVETTEPMARSKPTVPLGKYTKEKAKRQEYEEKLSDIEKRLSQKDVEIEELKKTPTQVAPQAGNMDARTLATIQFLAEREDKRQQEELFEKDFQALTAKYPNANTPEVKQHLIEVANKYVETPFDVLYKASDYYHNNAPTIEDGKKSVDEGGSKAKVNVENPSIEDYRKINEASDEDFNKLMAEKFGKK